MVNAMRHLMSFFLLVAVVLFCSVFAKAAPNSPVNKSNNHKNGGLITSNWSDFFNISRIQARYSAQGTIALAQSVFIRFPGKILFLETYDFEDRADDRGHAERFEINIGSPLPAVPEQYQKVFNLVGRFQKFTGVRPVFNFGGQVNISNLPNIESFAKKHKITTFIQLFPIYTNNDIGTFELLHYYSFPVYKKLYARGYNQLIDRKNKAHLVNMWGDIIYPLYKHFDIYYRLNYLNHDDEAYGQSGFENWLGVRVNFSF